jgi:hypothetical protein
MTLLETALPSGLLELHQLAGSPGVLVEDWRIEYNSVRPTTPLAA